MSVTATSFTDLLKPGETLGDVASMVLAGMINSPGLTVSSATYSGASSQAFAVGSFVIDEIGVKPAISLKGGLFLSSGDLPDGLNDQSDHSISHGGPGDADLLAAAQVAFPGVYATFDASKVTFDLSVNNPFIVELSLAIVFGSEEFPAFTSSPFLDIAAVLVNGTNYGLFNNDPFHPLSVNKRSVDGGIFHDNVGAIFDTEYNGFSSVMTVRVPLHFGTNSLKIGVADTGDANYDSGIYVTNVDPIMLPVTPGTPDSDPLDAGLAKEGFDITSGGDDLMRGTLQELDGDVIHGFRVGDRLQIEESALPESGFKTAVVGGSITISVDADGDDAPESIITLAGDYASAKLKIENNDGSTFVSLVNECGETIIAPLDQRNVIQGSECDDLIIGGGLEDVIKSAGGHDVIDGGNGRNFLDGGSGDDQVTGGDERDNLVGDDGDDSMNGLGGNDRIDGGQGNDTLRGGSGDDRLYGGQGLDRLIGGDGNDVLYAGTAADRMLGVDDTADIFVFDAADGQDKVFGFQAGTDAVELELTEGVSYSLLARGDNTILTYGSTRVVFYDAVLTDADIYFVV